MDPQTESRVQGETEEGEDKRFPAENSTPVDDCVPHALENGDQSSINPSTHHISPEQIKNDKKIVRFLLSPLRQVQHTLLILIEGCT